MQGQAGRQRLWSDEHLELAAELREHGLSEQSIANRLGVSRSTARRMLVRAGRVPVIGPETADSRREELKRLVRWLAKGASLADAADSEGLDVQHARSLIRSVPDLVLEPLPAGLAKAASQVRSHLEGDDVRAAARAAGIDPWFALFLLLFTGWASVSMQPTLQPETLERAALMTERRAAGASFGRIGAEFGMTPERVRRILLATGGWTSPSQRVIDARAVRRATVFTDP